MSLIAALLRGFLRLLRSAVFLAFLAFMMLVMNIAVLTSDVIHDALAKGLYRVVAIGAETKAPRTWRGADQEISEQRTARKAEEERRRSAEADAENARMRAGEAEIERDREAQGRRQALAERDDALERARQANREADAARRDRDRARTDAAGARTRAELVADERDIHRREARWAQRELQEITDLPPSMMARLARRNIRPDLSAMPHLSTEARSAARAANARLARRTVVGMTRNIGSMALEAVPGAGIGVIVGLTILEVKEACETLADSRVLGSLLNGEDVEDPPECGYSAEEIRSYVFGSGNRGNCTSTENPETGLQEVACGPLPDPGGGDEGGVEIGTTGRVEEP